MQAGSKFVKGAMVLTVAGIIVKILGAVYRIPLMNILGSVGMGLFMAVYPVYSMMLSISTAGVPLAVSKIVAERLARGNYRGAHQVFHVALGLMAASGLVVTGVLLMGARYYTANFLKTPDALYPLVAITPSILFFALKSAFRGFFQGQQSMVPTALSQVVEQSVRVITIFALSALLIKYGTEFGAAGAAFGTVTGALAALILLIIIYYKGRSAFFHTELADNNSLSSTRGVIKEILTLALPITIGSIVVPLVNMVDSTLILPRLQAGGFTETEALAIYGDFSGGAMPLVNVPAIFTVALATSLVPAISNAFARGNKAQIKKLSSLCMRIGMMIGMPAALGLFLLAQPISTLLYDSPDTVARSLSLVAFAVIFISLKQTTAPVLQGLGKTFLPVTHMFIGLIIKVGLNYFLTAIPSINILGPALGTIIAFMVGSALNYRAIHKLVGAGITLKETFVKPALNSIAMGVTVFVLYPPIYRAVTVLASTFIASQRLLLGISIGIVILLAVMVYGAASLLTGLVTRTELEMVPGVGSKLAKFLIRLKLIRS